MVQRSICKHLPSTIKLKKQNRYAFISMKVQVIKYFILYLIKIMGYTHNYWGCKECMFQVNWKI